MRPHNLLLAVMTFLAALSIEVGLVTLRLGQGQVLDGRWMQNSQVLAQIPDAWKAEADQLLKQRNGTSKAEKWGVEESGKNTLSIQSSFSPVNAQAQRRQQRRDEASRLFRRGVQQFNTSQFRAALETFQQVLVVARANRSLRLEGITLNYIGLIYKIWGQHDKALDFYRQALAIHQQVNNKRWEAVTLGNIGFVYQSLGEYAKALEFYQQALAIATEVNNAVEKGYSLGNIGFVYQSLGEYAKALEFYQQALAIHRQVGNTAAQGVTLSNIGFVYQSLGEYAKALDFYQQALTIHKQIRNKLEEGITLNNIGNVYQNLGQYAKALQFYQQALAIAKQVSNKAGEGYALDNIGEVYQRLGQPAKALEFYQQALTIYKQVGDRAGEGHTLSNIGILLEKQNQPELAIVFYKQSVNVRETIRKDIQGLPTEQQRSYTETVASTYRRLADLLLKQDRILEAQQVLDLLKIQELEDYLRNVRGNNQTAEGIPNTPSEQQIKRGYEAIFDQAIQLGKELAQLESIPSANRTPDQQQRILELRKNQQEISQQFAEFLKSPTVTTLVTQLRQVTGGETLNLANFNNLRDNLQKLQQNAVVLYPLVLDDRLELILVTPYSPPIRRTITVKREELNRTIVEFRREISDARGDIADAEAAAQKLYNWLIKPLENDLAQADAKTIIYAPDGQLRYIPLAALHDGKQWLVQRFRINNITAASLTDFNTKPQTNLQVLAGAFTQGSYSFQIGDRQFTMSGLPFAGREVENLAATIPGTRKLLDNQFNRDTVLLMNDYSIVHLATHAAFLVGQPEDSFIMFGNGERATLRDVENWSLPKVDLIVLSACQTAVGGKLGNGEEILGFGYQMQRTGARAAIASLWFVDDGGTQVLMDAFYAALKQPNITKAEALRQAQIALITGKYATSGQQPISNSNRLSHPFYWAPFILIGNGL